MAGKFQDIIKNFLNDPDVKKYLQDNPNSSFNKSIVNHAATSLKDIYLRKITPLKGAIKSGASEVEINTLLKRLHVQNTIKRIEEQEARIKRHNKFKDKSELNDKKAKFNAELLTKAKSWKSYLTDVNTLIDKVNAKNQQAAQATQDAVQAASDCSDSIKKAYEEEMKRRDQLLAQLEELKAQMAKEKEQYEKELAEAKQQGAPPPPMPEGLGVPPPPPPPPPPPSSPTIPKGAVPIAGFTDISQAKSSLKKISGSNDAGAETVNKLSQQNSSFADLLRGNPLFKKKNVEGVTPSKSIDEMLKQQKLAQAAENNAKSAQTQDFRSLLGKKSNNV